MAHELTIGQRVQMYRLRRGLTQEILAGRVGRSTSWLSQVERGLRPIESWRVILDLADVLQVDPRALVGRPLNLAPNGGRQYEALASIRDAIFGYGSIWASGARSESARDSAGVRTDIVHANRLYQAAHYEEAGLLLSKLVPAVEAAMYGDGPDAGTVAAAAALSDVYGTLAKTLTKVGESELGWVAGERALMSAQRAGDEARLGVAAYHLGHVFLHPGRMEEAQRLTTRAADMLAARPRTEAEDSVLGALHLTTLIAVVRRGDRAGARELLSTAGMIAATVGDDRNDFWLAFGPTNVAIHELAVAVEFGDAADAERIGESIDLSRLPSGLTGRRCQVFLDLARAYTQRRRDAAAVNMLIQAERIAPETIRYNAIVRDMIRELLRREHRASTPDLLPLAERVGVLD